MQFGHMGNSSKTVLLKYKLIQQMRYILILKTTDYQRKAEEIGQRITFVDYIGKL